MAIVNEEKYGNNSANTLVNNKKGYTYMSGLKGNDTYIVENISKSFTEIDDSNRLDESENPGPVNGNGIPTTNFGNDTIQIKNVKANDLALFFDVSLAPNVEASAPSDELYIVKKSAMSSVVKQVMKVEELWAQYEDVSPALSESEIEKLVMQKAAPQSGAVYIPYQFGDTNNAGSQMSASAIERIQVVDGKTGFVKTIDMREYIAEVKEEVVELLQEVKKLGLKNYYNESIRSAFQLVNSSHTKYKNKLFNIYKSEELDITIEGTRGNDKLVGENGDNTFLFKEGSGHDVITSSKGDDDKIRFVDVDTFIKYTNVKNDLVIFYNNGEDSVTIKNYLSKPEKSTIKEIEFVENGEVVSTKNLLNNIKTEKIEIEAKFDDKKNSIKGTALNDIIGGGLKDDVIKAGDGDDEIYGDQGNDKLYGGSGKNTYYSFRGEGDDVVYYDKKANNDTLSFYGIEQGDLHIEKGKYNGIKIVSEDGNSFELANYLKNGLTSVANIHTEIDDETIALKDFLNGKRIYQYGNVKNNKITGTSIADEIYGNDGKDTIQGKGGNDYLYGEAHDDTIKGGDGNDHLFGGDGNDKLYGEAGRNTFYFSDGDGKDIIYMGKGVDKIVFDDSVTEYNDDPVFIRNKNNLEIRYGSFNENGERNSVTVSNYFKSKYQSVQTVQINGEDYNLKDIVIEGKVNNFLYAVPVKEYVAKDDIVENNNLMYIDGKNNLAYGGYGDDMYHVSSLKNNTYIEDESGDDRLIINEKSSNINILFDVYSDGSVPTSGDYSSIIIMNDANLKKIMKYGDLTDVTSGIEISRGESGIEEIYSIDGKMINVEQLQNSVASWLSSNGYDSAMQVLESNDVADINELLNVYQSAWQ